MLILVYCYTMLCAGDHDSTTQVAVAQGTHQVVVSSPDNDDDRDCGILIHDPDGISLHGNDITEQHEHLTGHLAQSATDEAATATAPAADPYLLSRPPPPGTSLSGRALLISTCVQRT